MRRILIAITSALTITLASCGQSSVELQAGTEQKMELKGLTYKDKVAIIKVKKNIVDYKDKSDLGTQAVSSTSSMSPDVEQVAETYQTVVLEFSNDEQVGYNN